MQVSPVHLPPTLSLRRPAAAAAAPAGPSDQVVLSGQAERVQVVQRTPSRHGGWIELLRDKNPNLIQRNFHPRTTQRSPEVIAAFGTDKPHSGDALLHYAGDPPPGVAVKPTPVLLVHGASKSAEFWWDPKEDGSNQGLPQLLREQGFQVYAVSFAHNQDDQFFWAQQIANASERIRTLTGAPQIDLVGHSKGGQAARMYGSGVAHDWMARSQGDVRRLVLVAAPNGGIDTMFRHPSANYVLYGDSDSPRLNAPMSWERMVAWGSMRDTSAMGFSSEGPDHWPGQRQMLARWAHRFPVPMSEPDWHTTYEGGQGFVSYSKGIDHYIQEGGNLVERLHKTPILPGIQVAVLAGDKADIQGIVNERGGPSDGLLYLESALKMPRGTELIAQSVLHLNHKSLVSDRQGQQWIADVLADENPQRVPEKVIEQAIEAASKPLADGDSGPAVPLAFAPGGPGSAMPLAFAPGKTGAQPLSSPRVLVEF